VFYRRCLGIALQRILLEAGGGAATAAAFTHSSCHQVSSDTFAAAHRIESDLRYFWPFPVMFSYSA
jgi:hypothetical protein